MTSRMRARLERAHDRQLDKTTDDWYILEYFDATTAETFTSEPMRGRIGRHPLYNNGAEKKDFMKTRGGVPSHTEQGRYLNVLSRDLEKMGLTPQRIRKGGTFTHQRTGESFKCNSVMDEDHGDLYTNFKLETK